MILWHALRAMCCNGHESMIFDSVCYYSLVVIVTVVLLYP